VNVDLAADPVVLFAEDAVRSAVAHELLRWREDEVFYALLKAAKQRTTPGLIESLGEFCRSESIPVLFETLEDDLCRNAAFPALLKTPEKSRHYAILSLRGETAASLVGAAASRRRRATAELFRKLGIAQEDWQDVARLLEDEDPTVIIGAATVGLTWLLKRSLRASSAPSSGSPTNSIGCRSMKSFTCLTSTPRWLMARLTGFWLICAHVVNR
jgi:hypothetical protein